MKFNKSLIITLSLVFLLLLENKTLACSMYKITANGKTMVGCNEDAWRTTSKICFENAKKPNEYGVVYSGSRQVASTITAPQSGMNEKGLTFSRLASYFPKQNNPFINRTKIANEVDYLTDILHKCATVQEVKQYINQYDHSIFIEDVFIYIDSSGRYLVVEPYKLIEGNEPNYVLSNFCPSITNNDIARQLGRYRNGEDFLNTHEPTASLSFCKSLSDTMHVCRSRNGDGTLLTTIWDTKAGLVNVFFYHNYASTVQFNLTNELAIGDHILNIPDLFPKNVEFERLESYRTPFNTPLLRVSLVALGGFLTLLSFLLVISSLKNKNGVVSLKAAVLISTINLTVTAYLFLLATNIYIYYFDAPYQHNNSSLISASSFIPFLLLLTSIPFILFTIKRFKSVNISNFTKAILIANNLIYMALIVGFSYWGLYTIWN